MGHTTLEEMRAAHRATARYTVYLIPAPDSPTEFRDREKRVDVEKGLTWDDADALRKKLNDEHGVPGFFNGPFYGVELEEHKK